MFKDSSTDVKSEKIILRLVNTKQKGSKLNNLPNRNVRFYAGLNKLY